MVKHSLPISSVPQAYWFVVCQGKLWLPSVQVPFGQWKDFGLSEPEQLCQIGEWQQHPCMLAVYQDQMIEPEAWQNPRALLLHPQSHWFELAARATQLTLFLQTHRYCGQCGCAMHSGVVGTCHAMSSVWASGLSADFALCTGCHSSR